MKPSINYSKKDPKLCLLKEILKIIDDSKTYKIIGRNGIHNIIKFQNCMKIILSSMYFDYTISDLIVEINRQKELQTYFNMDQVPTEQQVYEFMNRFNPEQVNKIIYSILKPIHSKNRSVIANYIIDATPVEVDINIVKKYIKKEDLERLKLKWGYSKTKGAYIGFKVTVVLDKETLCPISILIHSGAPHDSKIFDETLKELKRRRLFRKRTIILFDKGYCSYRNYNLGINRYKIIPVIFPKYDKTTQKIKDNLSYPLDIYKSRTYEEDKKQFIHLKKILVHELEKWEDSKPKRGLIEDFFKVGKDAFGLGKFHKYTLESVSKSIYFCILLTALCVQQGYDTKTKMQQLSEGNVELRPVKEHRRKKKQTKENDKDNSTVPHKTGQQKLSIHVKQRQTKLLEYT